MSQEKEVTLETIQELKAKGFTHVKFELQDTGNPYVATLEVIPAHGEGSALDGISLTTRDILDYFEEASPMARYVIKPEYLTS